MPIIFSAFYYITSEVYYTSLLLSAFFSLGTALILGLRLGVSCIMGAAGILMLVSSRAFVDYSTSGLENPLTHILIAIFLCLVLSDKRPDTRRIALISLVAALGTLNRMDTILIFLPSLVLLLWKHRYRAIGGIVLGFIPFILWECFSVIYYGFPFPNTAYAKLSTGIPLEKLIVQGSYYYVNSFLWDPATLVVITSAMAASLLSKNMKLIAAATGALFFMGYILCIGGDFMSGRFLSPVYLCAVIILVSRNNPISLRFKHYAGGLVLFTAIFSILGPCPPALSGSDYGIRDLSSYIDVHGISDERGYYFARTGLIKIKSTDKSISDFDKFRNTVRRGGGLGFSLQILPYVGFYGFYTGPGEHILDPNALADPLLAHMPVDSNKRIRIGHFMREIPEGYIETLKSNRNVIADRDIADYYDKVRLITRGDLFSYDRFRVIWYMNTGRYEHLINTVRPIGAKGF